MAIIDKLYKNLILEIEENGNIYEDPNRKAVLRKQIPFHNFIFKNNTTSFPALTIKKLYFDIVVGELLWFLRGSNDIRELWKDNIRIWDPDWHRQSTWYYNTESTKHLYKELMSGNAPDYMYDLGRIYGRQWRKWSGEHKAIALPSNIKYNHEKVFHGYEYKYIDQITNLIDNLIKSPFRTDHIVTAWNPAEIEEVVLPPCHFEFQIMCYRSKKSSPILFDLIWSQRSVDVFLGLPFNIASYAVLGHIIAALTGYTFNNLYGSLRNIHTYDNAVNGTKQLLERDTDKIGECKLVFSERFHELVEMFKTQKINVDTFISGLKISDFMLENYESYDSIKVKMLSRDNK